MTRVCLLGSSDVDLRYELLSRETSRDALSAYDLEQPFENSLAVRTVSVGAAVSLLNDLQWYLVRFVDEALVQDPSVSDEEWFSRELAEAVRNGDVAPEDTDEYLEVYGVEAVEPDEPDGDDRTPGAAVATRRLVEPLFVRRTDGELPAYDLRDVDDTLVVRLTEAEFSP